MDVRDPKPGPVTDETVRTLEEAGMYELAEVARRYVKRRGRLRRWLRRHVLDGSGRSVCGCGTERQFCACGASHCPDCDHGAAAHRCNESGAEA